VPKSGRREIDEVGALFEALGAYCVETAALAAVDQLALFLHADGLRVRPAFLYMHGHVIVAFLDRAMLGRAIDAFNEGGPVSDLTSELDEQLPEETTLSGETLGAFLGPPLRAIAEAQHLGTVLVYMRFDDVGGAMALKFEDGRLLGAGDRGSAFVRTMWLIAKAGGDAPDGLESIDLTETVYQRLGREPPEPLASDDLLADFPDDPRAMTGDTLTVREGDVREIDLTAGARWALEEQRKLFRAKFGREPGPDDPVFFNPDADVPEPLTAEQQQAFQRLWEDHPELEEMRADAEARLEEHGHVRRAAPKPRRNDPCPCGSGKKFKHCHGR
jgi:hypothetical protein